jgi:hypothetical protein
MALDKVYTGAHGSLGVAVAGTAAQQADFNAISQAYGTALIGRVTDVEVCVRTQLHEYFEIGARDVQTIAGGNVHVSGSVGRAYVNGALLFLLLGRGASASGVTTIQPKFNLNLILNNPALADNSLKLNVLGVKFESWGLQVPQDDFVMENLRFKAVGIGILDDENKTDITVAFP